MAKNKQIAKLLRSDMDVSSDLYEIARMLASKGRGNDTILAHITEREAQMLKDMGGSGSINPETGLLEFQTGEDFNYDVPYAAQQQETPASEVGDFGPNVGAETKVFGTPETAPAQASPTQLSPEYDFPVPAGFTAPQGQQIATGVPGMRASVYSPGAPLTPPELAKVQQQTYPQDEDFLNKFTKGLSSADMIRLGLASGLGVYGAQQARRGAEAGSAAAEEQRRLAAPYKAKGDELLRAAQAGELTPTGQQSLQALQARMAQGAQARGGVGAAQSAAQIEAYRQQLLQQQYNLGLQVSQIGDQITLGAIRTGLEADRALTQASTNFYTQLAAIGAGVPIRTTNG